MIDATERIRPFSNGTQYMDWSAGNCEKCERYCFDEAADTESADCSIFNNLAATCFGDGTVSAEIAERMGYTRHDGHDSYGWPCCEKLPAWADCKEHKEEVAR